MKKTTRILPHANLTLRISRSDDSFWGQLVLTRDSGSLAAEFPFSSPVRPEDAADTRWLIEDHARLPGRSADKIAERIEERLSQLGSLLRSSVFEVNQETVSIAVLLKDVKLLTALHVRIEEPIGAPWTPWELMFAPGRDEPMSLCAGSFVRVPLEVASSALQASGEPALRILLVVARPQGEDDVPFRSVASRIVHAVASHKGLHVDLLRPPTFSALKSTLSKAASAGKPYDVVHFDGHGVYRESAFAPGRKQGYLRFEGQETADDVEGRTIGALLAECGVRLLLLNACRSAYAEPTRPQLGKGSTDPVLGSLATDVLAAGVPGVLAMNFNVYVVTAAHIIADTYAAYGAGRMLGEAVAYARRRQAGRDRALISSTFDWLVPVVYDTGLAPRLRRRVKIAELEIGVSTTTPATYRIVDPAAEEGPRSATRAFFGYDNVLLRLEHALYAGPVVELRGLAGSGKSAVAAEFARWFTATHPDRPIAVVIDLPTCSSFQAFRQVVEDRLRSVGKATAAPSSWHSIPALWVLEDVDTVVAEGAATQWPAEDRQELANFLDSLGSGPGHAFLTGRASSDFANTTVIALEGLDLEARQELASSVGWDAARIPAASALMEWSNGLPAIIVQLPRVASDARLASIDDTHEFLWHMRMGGVEWTDFTTKLCDSCKVGTFDVRGMTDPLLPLALQLFQGFLAVEDWKTFCGVAEAEGWPLGDIASAATRLHAEFLSAALAGLACRLNEHCYVLHPLAPICFLEGFDSMVAAASGHDPEKRRIIYLRLWSTYCMAQSTQLRVRNLLDRPAVVGSRTQQRQNFWHAIELELKSPWWGLALPDLRKLREELLDEQRADEWEAVLRRALTLFRRFPPKEEEMGPESAEWQIAQLLAGESDRFGDHQAAAKLHQLAAAKAAAEETFIVNEAGEKIMDVSRIRMISALIKLGDDAARNGSPECLTYYQDATRLAENDLLRRGEIQLAMARAFHNVPELRNSAKYEHFARLAFESGKEMGPLGKDLVARSKLSIGNAILEQLQASGDPNPQRASEARAALLYAAKSDAVTRASAHNGLGNYYSIMDNLLAAAKEYLLASSDFESLGDWKDCAAAQTNAARALLLGGKKDDARQVALEALQCLEEGARCRTTAEANLDCSAGGGGI